MRKKYYSKDINVLSFIDNFIITYVYIYGKFNNMQKDIKSKVKCIFKGWSKF